MKGMCPLQNKCDYRCALMMQENDNGELYWICTIEEPTNMDDTGICQRLIKQEIPIEERIINKGW